MVSEKIKEITRKLILAEKQISGISTVYPSSMFHMQKLYAMPSVPAIVQKIPEIPKLPAQTMPNLGKLNIFLSDNTVRAIECQGPGKNLRIKKNVLAEINMQLNESEIIEIINNLARLANAQVTPILKIDYGNLTLNAFISPALGSKFFLLKKQ
jgi:hypothetical protein